MPVNEAIKNVLKAKGIDHLYKFQEEAIKKILQGNDVVITAPTRQVKLRLFASHFCKKLQQNNNHGALDHFAVAVVKYLQFLFIQQRHYHATNCPRYKSLAEPLGVRVAILDGDTLEKERRAVIESPPDVIITNFDVLHYHMMHKTKFSRIVTTAKFLVVDEAQGIHRHLWC